MKQQPVGTYMLFGLIGFVCLLAAASPKTETAASSKPAQPYAAQTVPHSVLLEEAKSFLQDDEDGLREIGRWYGREAQLAPNRVLLIPSFEMYRIKNKLGAKVSEDTASLLREANRLR
jgi:hypothetical protein